MKEVLLICGSGASSGFMAASIRKAAKKRKLAYHVIARSESQLQDYLAVTDILLIGPHLAYMADEIKGEPGAARLKVAVIPQEVYGVLDGEACLDLILSLESEA